MAHFQIEAWEASERILAAYPGQSPLHVPASLCLLKDADGIKRIRFNEILRLLGSGSLLVVAIGVPAMLAAREKGTLTPPLLATGIVVAAIMLFLFLRLVFFDGIIKRRQVHEGMARAGELFDLREYPEQFLADIEDVDSFDKCRVFPQDRVIIAVDRTNNRLLIEGLCFRYIIRVEDLDGMGPIAAKNGMKALGLRYRIDEQTFLGLACAWTTGFTTGKRITRKQRRLTDIITEMITANIAQDEVEVTPAAE